MNHRLHRGGLILPLLAAIAHAAPALADPTPTDRNVARPITIHARDRLKAGDAQTARKLFQAAHALMGSPVTGLDMAKAEVALGLPMEARDTALEVTRIPVSPRESRVLTEARSAAAQLAADLAGRVPTLAIHVLGLPEGAEVSVRVDGSEIAATTLVPSRAANPGEHTVEASANGYVAARRSVTLKEGQALAVDLTLSPLPRAAPPPCPAAEAAVPPWPRAVSPSPPAAQADQGSGRSVPGWAWGVGAAGLAALGVGVGFAVDYGVVRGQVASDCPGNACDPARYDQAHVEALRGRWSRDIGMAMGFSAVGLIGVATAVGSIVKAKVGGSPSDARRSAQSGAVMVPWLSPKAAGVWINEVF